MESVQPQSPQSPKEDFQSMYTSLKRKYSELSSVKDQTQTQLDQAKREIKKLSKEKKYLLDKLIQFEEVSSDSDSDNDYQSTSKLKFNKSISTSLYNSNGLNANNIINNNSSSKNNSNMGINNNNNIVLDSSVNKPCIGKDNKPCKGKALPNSKYCWHHAPLDPNTDFIYCKYVSSNKKNNKKCNIPILKSKANPYCSYHQSKAMDQGDTASAGSTANTASGSSGAGTATPPQSSLPSSQNNTPPPPPLEQLSPPKNSESSQKKIKIENPSITNSLKINTNPIPSLGNPEFSLPSIQASNTSNGTKLIITNSSLRSVSPSISPKLNPNNNTNSDDINL